MSITNLDVLMEQLKALRIEHRELDAEIDALVQRAYADQLSLQRLKKRKLLLKDRIVKLESQLIPDLNA